MLSKVCEYTSLSLSMPVWLICSSIPFIVFQALVWYSVLQNPWYLMSFAIKLMLYVFRSISSLFNQLAYFLIFTSKFFVLVCTKFCLFFLTVFLISPQNAHVLGNIPVGLVLSSFWKSK